MRSSIPFHLLFHFISIVYQTNAFSMTMYPIDSPHLGILPKSFTKEDRHQFLRNISSARAFYFSKKNSKLSPNAIEFPLSHAHQSYLLAELSFGKRDPPFNPLVVVDMSSNQTWFQCVKCDPCFDLENPINPLESATFAKMLQDDDRCDPKQSYLGNCGFEDYFGDAHTEGYVGIDIFSFSNTLGNRSYFPNIAFGCGVHNRNFSWSSDGASRIAGIHGLGLGPRSFISQLSDEIKGRFSYCIPREKNESTITFGEAAQIGKNSQTIAMNPESRYHLYLAAISVNQVRLPIDTSIFELNGTDYKTGFFMDTSTPITVLNTEAYSKLHDALTSHFEGYDWQPISNDDLCYSEEPDANDNQFYPLISFHFTRSPEKGGEVEFLFDHESMFRKRGSDSGFCLNIGSTDGPSIFGAYQQSNHRFLFDINARELSFAPDEC